MVRPALGNVVVIRRSGPTAAGWAVIVLSALALTLGGCGRKGGLDAPPGAAGASGQPSPTASSDQDSAANKGASLFGASSSNDTTPTAPKGNKRPFVLDPLLNSQ
jgi:predicted small lipoprotein YifL